MEVITIHPDNNDQLEAIKAVLKALKIPFSKNKSPYHPEFIKKVHEAEKDTEGTIVLNSLKEIDHYFKNLENDVQD